MSVDALIDCREFEPGRQAAAPAACLREFLKTEAPDAAGQASSLLAAVRAVGASMGVTVVAPEQASAQAATTVEQIAQASGLCAQRVALDGDWFRGDCGPLVGYWRDGMTPVALVPESAGRYRVLVPGRPRPVRITATVAARLAPWAHKFYRLLPNRALRLPDVAAFCAAAARGHAMPIVALVSASAVLSLASPVGLAYVVDTAIPAAELGLLAQVCLGLAVVAAAICAFDTVCSIAVLRLQQKLGESLQSAVWERLLSLPMAFFRRYTAGDLLHRTQGVAWIRYRLSGPILATVLSLLISLSNGLLLFWYSARLAGWAIVLAAAAAAATWGLAYLQVRWQRRIQAISGRISGMLLQYFSALGKIRVAGAERQAFAQWARQFSAQRNAAFRAGLIQCSMKTFAVTFPILCFGTIYTLYYHQGGGRTMALGAFVAFTYAFGSVLAAGMRFANVLIDILAIVPLYERAAPIFAAVPEPIRKQADPGPLSGRIEANHLRFAYDERGPEVLCGVSLAVEAGQFVAVVGPSGSGKSTLLRLLLGLEQPTGGAVLYDHRELNTLDLRRVRRQIGVVLQNDRLIEGSLFDNIAGPTPITLDEAWEAACLAGVDEVIRALPLQMNTPIAMRDNTLSGGQEQRVLIARAIARRPRLMFLDEATSALDHRTQASVMKGLERLRATRVVVAHRLSTVRRADRIVVLQRGQIVQQGAYEELINHRDGLFAQMVRRQTDED
jgi:ATP-binding cassette subfamily C protein